MRQLFLSVLKLAFFLNGCAQIDRKQSDSTKAKSAVKKKTDHVATKKSSRIDLVELSFDYTRMSAPASNQIAVWIEDNEGDLVKTLYVSDFTGRRRGYEWRADTLKNWRKEAHVEEMSDADVDAISSPTLKDGKKIFTWDLSDASGRIVSPGRYQLKLEGTLYWTSNVLYTAVIDTSVTWTQEIYVTQTYGKIKDKTNRNMIKNVQVTERSKSHKLIVKSHA